MVSAQVIHSRPETWLASCLIGLFDVKSLIIRNNYAVFKEIRTRTITVQGSRGDSKKAKLFITLQRSEDFFENMKKFNDIREENEKLAAKNETKDADGNTTETKE